MFKALQLKAFLIIFGLGFALAVPVAIKIHLWRVDNLELAWAAKRVKAVEDAIENQQDLCRQAQAITKETNDGLIQDKATLAAELTAAKRELRQRGTAAQCISAARAPVVGEGGDRPAGAGEVLVETAVSEEELLEFGARQSEIASTLNRCIDYSDQVLAYCAK